MSNKLIFMHLPKCGGTTFLSILDSIYPPEEIFEIKVIDDVKLNTEDFISLSTKQKDKIKLLKGHLEFGIHEHFSEKSEYITFLRDPIERIVSYYYYVKRNPNHRLYQLNLFHNEMSLYDFVTEINEVHKGDVNNCQIRFISGIQDKEAIMLEKALENIENHFSFVGTVEKFNASLVILQKMYNWSIPDYKILNETSNRPKIDSLDAKTIDAIKYFNAGDIILYEEMSKLLESKLKNKEYLNLPLKIMSHKRYAHLKLMRIQYKNTLKRILKYPKTYPTINVGNKLKLK